MDNCVAAHFLGAFVGAIGAYRIKLVARRIDPKSKDPVEFVRGLGKITRFTFTVCNHDLSLRDASDEKAVALRIESNAFRNQFRILESECDGRNWCLRFFVGKGLSDFLELWISPDLIEAGITIRDQTEFPPLQTPKEFKGGVAFAKFRLK